MWFTVGRHAAGDGAGVDPIVAAALRQRPIPAGPDAPQHGADRQLRAATDGEGELGWPGEPGEGSGLGWPVDALGEDGAGQQQALATPVAAPPTRRRQGWRRLFGARDETARRTSAA